MSSGGAKVHTFVEWLGTKTASYTAGSRRSEQAVPETSMPTVLSARYGLEGKGRKAKAVRYRVGGYRLYRCGKSLDEGHGFSRAVICPALDGFSR
jgi:hypothetical protein